MYAAKYNGCGNRHETNRDDDHILTSWINKNINDVHNVQKISELENQGQISVTTARKISFDYPVTADAEIMTIILERIQTLSLDKLFVDRNFKHLQFYFDLFKMSGKNGDIFSCVIAMRENNLISYAYLSAELKEMTKYLVIKEKKIDIVVKMYQFTVPKRLLVSRNADALPF